MFPLIIKILVVLIKIKDDFHGSFTIFAFYLILLKHWQVYLH